MPVMADARNYITYSTTTLDEGQWLILMPRPEASATGSGLLAPFDRKVWLTLLLSLLTVGPFIYIMLIIRKYLTKDTEQEIYHIPYCLWFVYGALMKQGSTLSPIAGKYILVYKIFCFYLITFSLKAARCIDFEYFSQHIRYTKILTFQKVLL